MAASQLFLKETRDSYPKGRVSIIGAGPGDPELLTMKADRLLREADVILYDDLVSAELVGHYSALKIYTGKRKDCHHFEQDAINEEILRQALQGRKVARLKGGDPFVFGRGGEEIEVLRKHGIRYEIVPGITAAHGASAYSEIPLTMRKVSSSVAFCTGHPVNKIQVPDADTLVYYMVASSVHDVLDAVLKKGRSLRTKVAIVQNATRYNQKIFTGTIQELREREKTVYSPALLIIGENICQFIEENWFSKKKKVLIIGSGENSYDPLDCVTVHLPCSGEDDADRQTFMHCVATIGHYPVVLFSGVLAARHFFSSLFSSGKDVRHLGGSKILTWGNAALSELRRYGVVPDLAIEMEEDALLTKQLRENGITGTTVLLPGSNYPDVSLMRAVEAAGNSCAPLAAYTYGFRENEDEINLDFIDEIYFSSPSCVRNFHTLYREIPGRTTLSCADERTVLECVRIFGRTGPDESGM
ncbi:MAG: uroporphyrinogen-III C-methyltransferase [Chlorobiaceae bacterium]|nr:uroporphyrinogen-III C-methyltransferase [Chlorobiaceae bacterium]NTV59878.1 uroporphyrinogen-III C-methyltransferase [Chlorobiaceae bacterium]